jgi:dihydroneopterin aldolase
MTDIDVRALPCPGRHGAYEGERDHIRVFLVDVTLRSRQGLPTARPEELAAVARDAVAATSRRLLERVAFDVAEAALIRWDQPDSVWVRVTKTDPPGLEAAAEAVAITLSREQLRVARRSSARHARQAGRRARG